jgi:hypothetical protein
VSRFLRDRGTLGPDAAVLNRLMDNNDVTVEMDFKSDLIVPTDAPISPASCSAIPRVAGDTPHSAQTF